MAAALITKHGRRAKDVASVRRWRGGSVKERDGGSVHLRLAYVKLAKISYKKKKTEEKRWEKGRKMGGKY